MRNDNNGNKRNKMSNLMLENPAHCELTALFYTAMAHRLYFNGTSSNFVYFQLIFSPLLKYFQKSS